MNIAKNVLFITFLTLASAAANGADGGKSAPKLDFGFQDEAKNLAQLRAVPARPIREKYSVLMQLDGKLSGLTTLDPTANQELVKGLEALTPQFVADCVAAGVTDESPLTAFWQLVNLWREARSRLAVLSPNLTPQSWEPLAQAATNPLLKTHLISLFEQDRQSGVNPVLWHSHGLIRPLVGLLIQENRSDEITPQLAALYLMDSYQSRVPNTGHTFQTLKNIDSRLAYQALAATFAASAVEEILWRQNGDTPLTTYLDGLASGDVALPDALAVIAKLEARVRLAREDFVYRNRKQHVEFCDKWLNEYFGKLRTTLNAVYGD